MKMLDAVTKFLIAVGVVVTIGLIGKSVVASDDTRVYKGVVQESPYGEMTETVKISTGFVEYTEWIKALDRATFTRMVFERDGEKITTLFSMCGTLLQLPLYNSSIKEKSKVLTLTLGGTDAETPTVSQDFQQDSGAIKKIVNSVESLEEITDCF